MGQYGGEFLIERRGLETLSQSDNCLTDGWIKMPSKSQTWAIHAEVMAFAKRMN
jgi:hypothetical protein